MNTRFFLPALYARSNLSGGSENRTPAQIHLHPSQDPATPATTAPLSRQLREQWMKSSALAFFAVGLTLCARFAVSQQVGTQGSATRPDVDSIPEITVTAQKRSENLQDVPLAITAVSGDTLANRGVNSIEDLPSLAPDLNVGSFGGQARIAIRGIGFDEINPDAEGRVAYYLDGVYISRPAAQLATFFDVDQVEVLRGPQGTLYGRNATGGAIAVTSNQPTSVPSGHANVTYGNFNDVKVDAALSGPISETISARIAVSTDDHSGYFKDTLLNEPIDDANTRAVRGLVRFKPNDSLTWTLSADYFGEGDHNDGDHYLGEPHPGVVDAGVALGGILPTSVENINSRIEPENNRDVYGATSNLVYEAGNISLKSITGYRGSSYTTITDLDNTNLSLAGPFALFENDREISQELQALGTSGPVKWIGGLYYFDEHIHGGVLVPVNLFLFGGPNTLQTGYGIAGDIHTTAEAVFGQLDLAVTDALTAILGIRYGYESVSIDDQSEFDLSRPYATGQPFDNLPGFPRHASTHSDPVTPKAGLQFKASDDVDLYATASKGFKSGGFDLGVLATPFKPESIWDYEGGVKARSFNDHLRTDFSVFYYKYTNLQESIVNGATVLTENAASARLYGAELEFTAIPLASLQVDASIGYLHSDYEKFATTDPSAPQLGVQNLAGNELTQAPQWTSNVGTQYKFPVKSATLTLRGEGNYTARVFYTPFDNPAVSTPAYVKANAFLTFDSGQWNAGLYARNLFNKVTIANALVASSLVGSPVVGTLSPPRTFGLRVGYRF